MNTQSEHEPKGLQSPSGSGVGWSAAEELAQFGITLTALAELPPQAMLDESSLAAALDVSARTIRRMVDRCELPAGVRLGARRVWFAGKVLDYLSERAEKIMTTSRRQAERLGNP